MTIWNAVVLAALLGAFGMVMLWTNQFRLRAQIDDDLLHQAVRAAHSGPPHAPPRRGDALADMLNGRRADLRLPSTSDGNTGDRPPRDRGPARNEGDHPAALSQGGGPGGGPEDGGPDRPPSDRSPSDGPPPDEPNRDGFGGPPPQDPYAIADMLADVRRPRFFNRDGTSSIQQANLPAFDKQSLTEALTGRASYASVQYQGQPVRVYTRPLIRGGQIQGAVQFAHELSDLDLLWSAQLKALALVLPLGVLAAAFAAFVLTGRTLRPVLRITSTAAEIGRSQDLTRRLPVTGDDEMAELSRTFNDMLGRLEASFKNLESAYSNLEQAYALQQRFTADASHELRTPLTRLKLATSDALNNAATPEEMRSALVTADRAAEAMNRLVQQLLTLARVDAGQLGLHLEPEDLRVIVAEGLDQMSGSRLIESEFAEIPLIVNADAEHLKRVVVNFIENAIRHTPTDGRIRVEATQRDHEAVITVRDNGEGIAPEHLTHLFERFYRAESARNRKDGGSGLGLAICKNLVEAHGGRVEVQSRKGVGTQFQAFFPLIFSERSNQTISS